jgi:glycosyltransferase involved in cell wall biosynthesis
VSGPLVSILIPTYNGERFLGAALESALAQTYEDIEVVIADDASTDGTADILAAAAARDPRVRVERRTANLGAFGNTARLLGSAQGEYVKYLLHDDLLEPTCVERLLSGMQDSGAAMAFSRRAVIDEDGVPVEHAQSGALLREPGTIDGGRLGSYVLESCTNIIGEVTTVLFRRADVDLESLYRIDGRRLTVLADVSLWLRLLARGNAFYTPESLSSFRRHAQQMTSRAPVRASGAWEWAALIDWGRRHGFLGEPAAQRRAYAVALRHAAAIHADLADPADAGLALEAVFNCTAALVELATGGPADPERPLWERTHERGVLDRFAQDLSA